MAEYGNRLYAAALLLCRNDHDAEVLVLRFFEGRCLEEIAAMAEVPVGTVKSRLHNAKAAFRAALEAEGIKGYGGAL